MTQAHSSAAAPNAGSAARRSSRILAVQILYQLDFGEQTVDQALQQAAADKAIPVDIEEVVQGTLSAPDFSLVEDIVRGVQARQGDIDPLVTGSLAVEWKLERLEPLLRAVLRAGAYELLASVKTPAAMIITDYVDVAHAFFAAKEPGLINAVLDKIAKAVRP